MLNQNIKQALEQLFSVNFYNGKNIARCPLHEDNHSSLGVKNDRATCFAQECFKNSDVIEVAMKSGMDFREAVEYCYSNSLIEHEKYQSLIKNKTNTKLNLKDFLAKKFPCQTYVTHYNYKCLETGLKHSKIRFQKSDGSKTFAWVNYKSGNPEIGTASPIGKKNIFVYNSHLLLDPNIKNILVVEGEKDVDLATRCGLHAICIKQNLEQAIEIIFRKNTISSIIFAFDSDEAGNILKKRTAETISRMNSKYSNNKINGLYFSYQNSLNSSVLDKFDLSDFISYFRGDERKKMEGMCDLFKDIHRAFNYRGHLEIWNFLNEIVCLPYECSLKPSKIRTMLLQKYNLELPVATAKNLVDAMLRNAKPQLKRQMIKTAFKMDELWGWIPNKKNTLKEKLDERIEKYRECDVEVCKRYIYKFIDILKFPDNEDRDKYREYLYVAICTTYRLLWDESWIRKMILVIYGPQSSGKTAWISKLIGRYNPELNLYNSETDKLFHAGASEIRQIDKIQGLWAFLDESKSLTGACQDSIKKFSTMRVTSCRPAYAKQERDLNLYLSFICATNDKRVILDPTGSDRYFCIEVEKDTEQGIHFRKCDLDEFCSWKIAERAYFLSKHDKDLCSDAIYKLNSRYPRDKENADFRHCGLVDIYLNLFDYRFVTGYTCSELRELIRLLDPRLERVVKSSPQYLLPEHIRESIVHESNGLWSRSDIKDRFKQKNIYGKVVSHLIKMPMINHAIFSDINRERAKQLPRFGKKFKTDLDDLSDYYKEVAEFTGEEYEEICECKYIESN